MAVYKSTYCYPYLSAVDLRVTPKSAADLPAEFLSCQVDTSNSKVTGYSIRLLDDLGNQIFPTGTQYISPITELQQLRDVYEEGGTNSGYNGTQLKIPFFQNNNDLYKLLKSYNAIYYDVDYSADHIILDDVLANELNYTPNDFERASNWEWDTDNLYLHLSNSVSPSFPVVLDGEVVVAGDTVAVVQKIPDSDPSLRNNKSQQLYTVDSLNGELILRRQSTQIGIGTNIVVLRGDLLHNCVFDCVEMSPITRFNVVTSSGLWRDCNGQSISGLQVDGRNLRWELTIKC